MQLKQLWVFYPQTVYNLVSSIPCPLPTSPTHLHYPSPTSSTHLHYPPPPPLPLTPPLPQTQTYLEETAEGHAIQTVMSVLTPNSLWLNT